MAPRAQPAPAPRTLDDALRAVEAEEQAQRDRLATQENTRQARLLQREVSFAKGVLAKDEAGRAKHVANHTPLSAAEEALKQIPHPEVIEVSVPVGLHGERHVLRGHDLIQLLRSARDAAEKQMSSGSVERAREALAKAEADLAKVAAKFA